MQKVFLIILEDSQKNNCVRVNTRHRRLSDSFCKVLQNSDFAAYIRVITSDYSGQKQPFTYVLQNSFS